MIKGIGIDICQISRMSLDLYNKILTHEEILLYNDLKHEQRKKEFLAGRFSAKEAIYKALSALEKDIYMQDIVILYDDKNKPYVSKPIYKDKHIWISISHEKEYAIAQAIVESIEK